MQISPLLRPHDLDRWTVPAAPSDAPARTLWGMRLGATADAGAGGGAGAGAGRLGGPGAPTPWVGCALPLLALGDRADGPRAAAPVDDAWLAGDAADGLHSGQTGAVRWWQRGA